MNDPKVDRRYKRTQKLLMDALIAVAQRTGYDSVTIRDITDEADISYSTFFRHYDDKDQLLMSIMQGVIAELREHMQEHLSPESDGTLLFQHIRDNQALYRTLLGGINSSGIVQNIQNMIVGEILHSYPDAAAGVVPLDVAANHIAASTLAMVKWWLDNEQPYSPERMGAIYAALIIRPARQP